jgi:uncharacterized protein YunC (DUF1805 family)
MLESEIVKVGSGSLLGVRVDLPTAPVLMLVGNNGFLGCGYFKPEVADKVGHALAVVSGVGSFADMLAADVVAVSTDGEALGIRPGMKGAEAAALLC